MTEFTTTTYTCGHVAPAVRAEDALPGSRYLAVCPCPACRIDALEARLDALDARLAADLDATDSRLDEHSARIDAITEHSSFEAHWNDPNPCASSCPYWSSNRLDALSEPASRTPSLSERLSYCADMLRGKVGIDEAETVTSCGPHYAPATGARAWLQAHGGVQ